MRQKQHPYLNVVTFLKVKFTHDAVFRWLPVNPSDRCFPGFHALQVGQWKCMAIIMTQHMDGMMRQIDIENDRSINTYKTLLLKIEILVNSSCEVTTFWRHCVNNHR